MNNNISPIVPQKRIVSIDILRGLALLGILLVNILGFNASFFDFGGFYNNLPNSYQATFYSIYISLTADKFIFIFSFLFGYGIYMQYHKFSQQSKPFQSFFTRRMLVLACFGIVHIIFLWAGDILLLYAIAGLFLLLIYKMNSKLLLALSFFFYFFIVFYLLLNVKLPYLPDAMSSTCTKCLKEAINIYSSGDYLECMKLRLFEYFSFRNINVLYYLPKVIGIITMGFLASKYDLYHKIVNNRKKWTLILVVFAIGSAIIYFNYEKIVNFEKPNALALYMFGYELLNIFIALTYILITILVSSNAVILRILSPIGLMGRMSLTNYLFQSILLSIIFYGWGFGLFGHTIVTNLVIIAICIYIIQVIYSVFWFQYYKQGPLEWLWRKISYRS